MQELAEADVWEVHDAFWRLHAEVEGWRPELLQLEADLPKGIQIYWLELLGGSVDALQKHCQKHLLLCHLSM